MFSSVWARTVEAILGAYMAPASPDPAPPLNWSAWLSGFAKEFTSDHLKVPFNLLVDQVIRGSVSQLLDPSSEATVRNRHAQLLKGAIEGVQNANGEQETVVQVSLPVDSLSHFDMLYSSWTRYSRTASLLFSETLSQPHLLISLLRIFKPEVPETQPPKQSGQPS